MHKFEQSIIDEHFNTIRSERAQKSFKIADRKFAKRKEPCNHARSAAAICNDVTAPTRFTVLKTK